jgi:hypothetical protein
MYEKSTLTRVGPAGAVILGVFSSGDDPDTTKIPQEFAFEFESDLETEAL